MRLCSETRSHVPHRLWPPFAPCSIQINSNIVSGPKSIGLYTNYNILFKRRKYPFFSIESVGWEAFSCKLTKSFKKNGMHYLKITGSARHLQRGWIRELGDSITDPVLSIFPHCSPGVSVLASVCSLWAQGWQQATHPHITIQFLLLLFKGKKRLLRNPPSSTSSHFSLVGTDISPVLNQL